MEKIELLKSSCIPLPIEDVDTDQIIPARFLKATTKEGFGQNLFRDWRYHSNDTPKEDFILNNSIYSGSILVAGKNFGCGSSREHAAWSLYDFGIRVVISSFFADIFQGNALNNGLLPITVDDAFLDHLFQEIEKDPRVQVEVSVPDQTVRISSTGQVRSFDLDPYKKLCLINGYDDIDYLLSIKEKIEQFEFSKI
ncbi:MAG: 3-isopropylmalate dehydratase small subunit [Saprospiraceae bacterium]|nr:3-isopropylmalate dehydratase small subunit [Saprospiraceae bacterium]